MDKNPNHHKSKTSAANQRRRNLDEWANRYKSANKGNNIKKETNMSATHTPKDLPNEPKASEEDLEEIKKIYGNGKSEDEVEAAAKAAEAAAEKLRSTAKAALDEAQAKTKDVAEEEEVVLEEKYEDLGKETPKDVVDYFGSATKAVAKQLHITSMSKAISGWFWG